MFLIEGRPANDVLTPIVKDLQALTPTQIEAIVRFDYDEEWFDSSTSSEKGNDNRLNHRIRSIRSKMDR